MACTPQAFRPPAALAADGALPLAAACATPTRFASRVARRYGDLAECVSPSLVQSQAWGEAWGLLQGRGLDAPSALRVLRQMTLTRLIEQDDGGESGLRTLCGAMSSLAAFALDAAQTAVLAQLGATHGDPLGPDGEPAQLWVVGMGKLGARELNASSDIDLIYIYDFEGQTRGNAAGLARLSNHEFFAKVARGIQRWIADVTEHGFVFRIDLALRPNGNSGPIACSLAALEDYFVAQGREWERFAWLKSRVVAPFCALESGRAQALRSVVLPFVFRKYLDYAVFDALRQLHRQIREHAAKRAAGHPERANDVKLSRGGIREIEFTVQLLQVVRGGHFPELRTRATLDGISRIARAGLMPAATAQRLQAAYVFLRNVEHRIQYQDDLQTHILPSADADLQWIAHSLGLPSVCALLCQLDDHREFVASEFNKLLGGVPPCPSGNCSGKGTDAASALDALQQTNPPLAERVQLLLDSSRARSLRPENVQRLHTLLARTGQWFTQGRIDQAGALRSLDWLEPLLKRESYLALLTEQPQVHARVVQLLGAARWPARYLMTHPDVIDELASADWLSERFDRHLFTQEVAHRREALIATGEDDDEALMNLLRRAHQAEVFRTLARDVEGVLRVEEVADDLSSLADAVLAICTQWVWQRVKGAHCDTPQCAILSYGKLGGKELGYGSDLDIVFVYADLHERAGENYAALVRKLINWLTTKTAQGDLFEIDTALRPNGSAGLLVTSIEAFEDYQTQRGSNAAWTWEHQAITRARVSVGQADLVMRFDAVRARVLQSPRDAQALRQEILDMRGKVRAAHRVSEGRFDIKHSAGGMVDVEFAVQFLVLSNAAACPALLANAGNIALLELAEQAQLLPAGVGGAAGSAYRNLRKAQHLARLDEAPTQLDAGELLPERAAVLALWRTLFGD